MEEIVVVLHGLGRRAGSMRPLSRKLEKAGYETVLIDYPSMSEPIGKLVDMVFAQLPEGKLHFVGHSLGGILAKRLMFRLPPERRGRIVQLSSPNFGSELAERIKVLEPLMGPTLEELHPHDGEDDTDLDIGAIAGTAALAPYGLITGIEGENDGKVSVESAWGNAPEGKRVKFRVAHSTMMMSSDVIDATLKFLKEGRF